MKKLKDFIDKVNADEGETVLRRDEGKEKIYGEAPPRIGSSADPHEPPKKPVQNSEGFAAEVNIPAPENQTAEYTEQKIPERFMSAGVEENKAVEPAAEVEGNMGIIGAELNEENNEILNLGTIDSQLLEAEFGKLKTDEIIVTKERLVHINEHHPKDYQFFQLYGKEAITVPDEIIKDGKNEKTVFMVKYLDETNLNVVVKLVLDNQVTNFKNSVITFFRLRDGNLEKERTKNGNKVLYKKE